MHNDTKSNPSYVSTYLVINPFLILILNKPTSNHLILAEEEGGLSERHFLCGGHQDAEVTRVIVW